MVTLVTSPVTLMILKFSALYFFRGNQVPQLFSGKMGNENSLFGDTCKDLHLFFKRHPRRWGCQRIHPLYTSLTQIGA